MLLHRTGFIVLRTLLLGASVFVLALPATAAAQVSVGVTIGQGPARRLPPPARGVLNRPGGGQVYQLAYSNGYADGHEKGIEDGRHWRSFDPDRHSRYRNADHRYNRRYGPRFEYQRAYRDGFLAGYQVAYRDTSRYRGYSRDWDPRRRW